MQSHVQRPFVGLLLLCLSLLTNQASGFSLSNLFSALSDPSLSISTSDSAQQFEGWGTSLAWFGEYVGSLEGVLDVQIDCSSAPAAMQSSSTKLLIQHVVESQIDIVADMLFDPEYGLGLEIVRYNIGGSNTTLDAVNSMRSFAAVPSVISADGSYNWTLVSIITEAHVQRMHDTLTSCKDDPSCLHYALLWCSAEYACAYMLSQTSSATHQGSLLPGHLTRA